MLIGARTAAWSKSLPYDAEVEYIGTLAYPTVQYIDCDFYADATTCVVADMQFESFSQYTAGHPLTGQYAGDGSMRFVFGRGSNAWSDWYFGFGNMNNRTGLALDTSRHVFKLDGVNRKAYVDNSEFSITGNFSAATAYEKGFVIFNRMDPATETVEGNAAATSCKLWSFEASKNGVKIRNMIPVRVGSVGYLYDRVSKQLFGNAGTGAFVVGPDKT